MKNKIKNNQGQITIIVLLASAIILTLGLSASKKTVTDTKVDIDQELLKEAFNAAESGINNYMNVGSTSYNAGDGSNATVSLKTIGGGANLTSEGLVPANTPQLFWLVNHNSDGSIGTTYYPSNTDLKISVDSAFTGALKIDYFYKSGAVYSVSRSGVNFHATNVTVTGYPNTSSKDTTINTGAVSPLLIIVTPLGGSTGLTISGSSAFPLQGEELTSVGTANNNVKTQVKTRNIYQIPSFFTESITARNIIQ